MRAIDFIIEQQRKEAGKGKATTRLVKNLVNTTRMKPKLIKVTPAVQPIELKPTGKNLQLEQSTGNPIKEAPKVIKEIPKVQEETAAQAVERAQKLTNSLLKPAVQPPVPPVVAPVTPVAPINWTERMKQWYDKDPVKTVALTGGGVYAGTKLLDNVFDKEGSAEIKVNKYAKKFIGK